MKKFLLLALCAISTMSLFAEPFSLEKIKSFKTSQERNKYAFEAQVSSESTQGIHAQAAFGYIVANKKNLTVSEINQLMKKFDSINDIAFVYGRLFASYGHEKYAYEYANRYNDGSYRQRTIYFDLLNFAKFNNREKVWEYGTKILDANGIGCVDDVMANTVISTMFRYKTKNITKEQQIEFLSKLAQIYPIPGTDFNKWKSVMGFVGFKYKQLTGKELF